MSDNNFVPNGWEKAKLGDIANLVGGGTPSRKKPEYFTGNIVWLTPSQIPKNKITKINDSEEKITEEGLKKSSAKILPKGTVLMTSRASIGYIAIAGTEVTTNQGFASFICNPNIYNWYLAYWLMKETPQIEQQATGTTFKEISKTNLKNFYINFPPVIEQKRIVSKIEELFSQLDAGVAGLKRAQAELARYRASVLKAAFEGRLVPQDPNDEPAVMLPDKESNNLRNREYYIDLPESWKVCKLKDLCEKVTKGSTPTTYGFSYQEKGVRFIKAQNINPSGTINHDTDFISIEANDYQKRSILKENDILFSIAGTIGRVGIVRKEDLPANTNQALAIIRGLSPIVNTKYIFHLLSSTVVQEQAINSKVGVGRANISLGDIKDFVIPIPPLNEQQRIVNAIEKFLSILDDLEESVIAQLGLSENLKNSILQSAFEGKLL